MTQFLDSVPELCVCVFIFYSARGWLDCIALGIRFPNSFSSSQSPSILAPLSHLLIALVSMSDRGTRILCFCPVMMNFVCDMYKGITIPTITIKVSFFIAGDCRAIRSRIVFASSPEEQISRATRIEHVSAHYSRTVRVFSRISIKTDGWIHVFIDWFSILLSNRLRLSSTQAIFLIVNNRSMASLSKTVLEVYREYHDPDGFLYLSYASQEAFGCDSVTWYSSVNRWLIFRYAQVWRNDRDMISRWILGKLGGTQGRWMGNCLGVDRLTSVSPIDVQPNRDENESF